MESICRRADIWMERGKKAFENSASFHNECAPNRFYCEENRIQPTLGKLIRLAIASEVGRTASKQDVRVYQRDRWGVPDGSLACLELSALPEKCIRSWHYNSYLRAEQFSSREAYFSWMMKVRVPRIAEEIQRWRPKFVVFYGGGKYQSAFKTIEKFVANDVQAQTKFVVINHPARRGSKNADFENIGFEIVKKIARE